MKQQMSSRRSPELQTLSYLEGLLFTSLRITKKGHEAVRQMHETIGRLPMPFRLVFTLSYLEGFSSAEIANLAGVETDMVEHMLGRGRKLISKLNFQKKTDQENLSLTLDQITTTTIESIISKSVKLTACGRLVCCGRHHEGDEKKES